MKVLKTSRNLSIHVGEFMKRGEQLKTANNPLAVKIMVIDDDLFKDDL